VVKVPAKARERERVRKKSLQRCLIVMGILSVEWHMRVRVHPRTQCDRLDEIQRRILD